MVPKVVRDDLPDREVLLSKHIVQNPKVNHPKHLALFEGALKKM